MVGSVVGRSHPDVVDTDTADSVVGTTIVVINADVDAVVVVVVRLLRVEEATEFFLASRHARSTF